MGSVIAVVAALLFHGWIAVVVPWTRIAVAAWVVSLPVVIVLVALPWPQRLLAVPIELAWAFVLLFPDRSPVGPLWGRERACQDVVKRVSGRARAAYGSGTLGETLPALLADVKAIDPPDPRWAAVKSAQLLDLRADPPQVGVGTATQRLLSWPWRDALDQRIVPLRLRIDDAMRARRLRRNALPAFEDLTRAMRYDYFFLRILVARMNELRERSDWPTRWSDEFAQLLALGREVRAPDEHWARVRDLALEVQDLERTSASRMLGAGELERLTVVSGEARRAWDDLERDDPSRVAQQV
jgi:hypothetical protein